MIRFTESEIEWLQKDPTVYVRLMMYHELQQLEADSIWGVDEAPQGNAKRQKELKEAAKAMIDADPEEFFWMDDEYPTAVAAIYD